MAARYPALVITTYAAPGDLARWLIKARAGDRMVYARGPGTSPANPTVQMIADWRDSGEARPFIQRVGDELTYQVERLAPRAETAGRDETAGAGERPASRLRISEDERETPMGRVLVEIARCANMGLPCPANGELARRADLRDGEAARYQIKKLVEAGHIKILQADKFTGLRVLQVVQTGRRTL